MSHCRCSGLRAIGPALAIVAILAVQSAGFAHRHPGAAGARSESVSGATAAPAGSARVAGDPAAGSSSACVLCDALRGRVALAEAAPAGLDAPVARTAPRPPSPRPELSASAPRAPPLSA